MSGSLLGQEVERGGLRIMPRANTAGVWQAVTGPGGWGWSLPFALERKDRAFRPAEGWDVSAYAPQAPAAGVAYYVKYPGGSNANTGLDWEHALRDISAAVQKADVGEIHIAEGVYDRVVGGWGVTATRSLAVYGYGSVIVSGHQSGLAWALDGTLTHTYKVTRSAVQRVLDVSLVDEQGDYGELVKRTSAEEVEANPGSWYLDGSNVLWVRTADSRAPDADLWPEIDGVGIAAGDITVYLENLTFIGHAPFWMHSTAAGQTPKLYAKDCVFKYADQGMAGGLRIEGVAEVYLQNCLAARNAQDGFNYHGLNGIVPKVVEIGCVGRDNGPAHAADIDNGSSIHEGGTIVRIGGEYYRNAGPNVIDIEAAQSWNLGCLAHDSVAQALSAGFEIAQGAGGEMWLDRCRAWGNGADVLADTGCALHQRGCGYYTTGGEGTLDEY